MAHTFTNLLTHVIFSTKDRTPFLDAELKSRLCPYLGGIVRELKSSSLIINGSADHVHVLARLPPTLSPADFMRVLKTNSSKWVHEQFPSRSSFAWQTGYGAFSVSESKVEEARRYIASQEEHHKKVTFQEEFMAFLKKHGVAYDERYIWS